MSASSSPSIYDVAQRTPIAQWQTVDVQFLAANVDTVVPHFLLSANVRFIVVDANVPGRVFRGTKAATADYLVLQADTPGTYHIQLHVEITQGAAAIVIGPSAGSTGPSGVIPPGMYGPYAGTTVPAGWLLCDGASYLRSDYPNLFTSIGTLYGSADATHFNVPDSRRRTLVGSGGVGTGTLGNAVGNVGGEETHVLTVAELAAHAHPGSTVGITDPGHFHTGHNVNAGGGAVNVIDQIISGRAANPVAGALVDAATTGITATPTIASQGSGTAHNNLQPSLVAAFIIKT